MNAMQLGRWWQAHHRIRNGWGTRGGPAHTFLAMMLAFLPLSAGVSAASGSRLPPPQSLPSQREPFTPSTAALYEPGASRSFFLRAPGDIDNGEWSTVISMTSDGLPPSAPGSIRYVSPGVPLALLDQGVGGVRFQLSAVLMPDSALAAPAASIQVSASNFDNRTHLVRIGASFDPNRSRLGFAAPDARSNTGWSPQWATDDPRALAHGLRQQGGSDTSAGTFQLAPGKTARLRFLIPAYAESSEALRRIARQSHEVATQRAIQRWAAALDSGLTLDIPDSQTVAAFRSSVSVLLGCTQLRNGHTVPIGNPFQYRDVWLRDGSRCASSLAVAGHTDIARRIVRGFLAYKWPQGPFMSQRGQLDGTGHVLWAMGQVCLRPGPAADLRAITDAGLAAWRWSESERTATQLLGMKFGGLLPPLRAARQRAAEWGRIDCRSGCMGHRRVRGLGKTPCSGRQASSCPRGRSVSRCLSDALRTCA